MASVQSLKLPEMLRALSAHRHHHMLSGSKQMPRPALAAACRRVPARPSSAATGAAVASLQNVATPWKGLLSFREKKEVLRVFQVGQICTAGTKVMQLCASPHQPLAVASSSMFALSLKESFVSWRHTGACFRA